METVPRLGNYLATVCSGINVEAENADVGSMERTTGCLKSLVSPSFVRHRNRSVTQLLHHEAVLAWVLEATAYRMEVQW